MSPLPQLSMRRLVGPILAENLLRLAVTSVDVFMLSMFSDQAVAAVGLANQYVIFLNLVYSVVGSGVCVVLAQTLGARRQEEASRLASISLALATGFGVFMSALMMLGSGPLLAAYPLEPMVRDYAWQFMMIYGGGSIFVAYNVVQSGLLRTSGNPRDAMMTNILANLVNIAGNWIAIKGMDLGIVQISVTGVAGVAVSTVFSQALACLVFSRLLARRGVLRIRFRGMMKDAGILVRRIFSVGIPSAGESLAYNIAQIVLMGMTTSLGTAAMSAWVYNLTVLRFVFAGAFATAQATQIQVGHLVGAGKHDLAYRKVWIWYLAGLSISVSLVVLANLFAGPLFGLFTKDPQIIMLARSLLLVSIFLETGRASNLVIIHGLKGSGDVKFPVFIGMVSMWGFGVLGGWTMGFALGLGLLGIWSGVALDEFVRGIVMMLRWKSRAWMSKSLVGPAIPDAGAAIPGSGGMPDVLTMPDLERKARAEIDGEESLPPDEV